MRTELLRIEAAKRVEHDTTILRGEIILTEGRLYLHGQPIPLAKQRQALRKEIVSITSCPEFAEGLSIADNLVAMSRRPGPLFLRPSRNRAILNSYLDRFGVAIDPDMSATQLSQIQRFLLQFLRLYHAGARIILLDLLSYALTEDETVELFQLLIRLREAGMSFLLLSQRPLLPALAVDRTIVLRHAMTIMEYDRNIPICSAALHSSSSVIAPPHKSAPEKSESVVLEIRDLNSAHVHIPSLQLHCSEIAEILCTTSEQQTDLFRLLNGDLASSSGEIVLCGERITDQIRRTRIRRGLVCAENRLSDEFLFQRMNVFENYAFLKGMSNRRIWWSPRIKRILREDITSGLGRDVANRPVSELSPIELQKLKYLSYLLLHPKVLVCLEPFLSVSLETEQVVHEMLTALADAGIAVLILSGTRRSSGGAPTSYYSIDEHGNFHQRNSFTSPSSLQNCEKNSSQIRNDISGVVACGNPRTQV